MARSSFASLRSLCDLLSFDSDVRGLVEALNRRIEAPEKLQVRLRSHPAGFAKEISRRRMGIAEAYLRLITSNGIEAAQTRLDALQSLVHQALRAKSLSMPLNTTRVQTALMKECVMARGNPRRQHELMSDFAQASFGQPGVIRRLLAELDLIEVPEDGRPLGELGLGQDDHVHDFLSEGRKSPSQLLLDAFIQGLSRVCVVYYTLPSAGILEELREAGRILGLEVEAAVEFSVGPRHGRRHFLCALPGARPFADEAALEPFVRGLQLNADRRREIIWSMAERFNEGHLRELNARFRERPFLQLGPLRRAELEAANPGGELSRIQLGHLLAERMRPVLQKRALYLKNQLRHAADSLRGGGGSSWEVENARLQYEEARAACLDCTAANLRDRYVGPREWADYDSAFASPREILPRLAELGAKLYLIYPLAQGPGPALETLVETHQWLSGVETFNLADAQEREPADLRRLEQAIALLNRGARAEVERLFGEWGAQLPARPQFEAACEAWQRRPLEPRRGTGYGGRDGRVPGMGLADAGRLAPKVLRGLRARGHAELVLPTSTAAEPLRLLVLARAVRPPRSPFGDEPEREPLGLGRFWRYLNPGLKNVAKIVAGAVPAWLVVGPAYAALWLGITAGRNVVVDLIAASGLYLRGWRLSAVDRRNIANSLFFTGLSVPLLAAAKQGFDLVWPMISADTGVLRAAARFWILAFTNGLYLATHNKLRGFDREVVLGNIFRSVLAWPLATAGSFGLDLLAIPAIVQTKIWSDVVAAAVEGSNKVGRLQKLSQRNLLELLETVRGDDAERRLVAMADLLFIWARRYQGRSALRRLLTRGAQAEHAWRTLHQRFSAEGSIEALTSLLLEHYSERDAVVLTDALAEHHGEFCRWLEAVGPNDRARVGAAPGSGLQASQG